MNCGLIPALLVHAALRFCKKERRRTTAPAQGSLATCKKVGALDIDCSRAGGLPSAYLCPTDISVDHYCSYSNVLGGFSLPIRPYPCRHLLFIFKRAACMPHRSDRVRQHVHHAGAQAAGACGGHWGRAGDPAALSLLVHLAVHHTSEYRKGGVGFLKAEDMLAQGGVGFF